MGDYGNKWSDEEILASIAAYRRLLDAERRGAPLSKRDIVDGLMTRIGRTKASIEMRLQNISAVLDENGQDWVDGYKPLRHYPHRLRELVDAEFA